MDNSCVNCEYTRQAGKKDNVDQVGCVQLTHTDKVPISFTGKVTYKGYWHNCRVQDLENTGSLVYGTLVDSNERCGYFQRKAK